MFLLFILKIMAIVRIILDFNRAHNGKTTRIQIQISFFFVIMQTFQSKVWNLLEKFTSFPNSIEWL